MSRGPLLPVVLLLMARVALAAPSDPALEGRRPADAETIDFDVPSPEEPWLGVTFEQDSAPARIAAITAGSPADRAGLLRGDALVAFEGTAPPDATAAAWMVRVRKPGERVRLDFLRDGALGSVPLRLGGRPGRGALFRGDRFRLAVIPVTLADRSRGDHPTDDELDRMVFSIDHWHRALPSGRRTHGSLRDYWRDQSGGALDVVGRVLRTVAVPAPTRAFAHQPMGAFPDSLWARTIRILQDRDGADVLADYDGVAFLYPGPVASPPRRGLWPHRDLVRAGGRLMPYLVKNLGSGTEPPPIGVLCHEFGHLLGLPDQYGTAHRTGVGDWCVMGIGHRGGGRSGPDRPFGLCAWCRSVLGWLRPAAVSPFVPQDLRLRPSAGERGEAFLLPGDAEGECFLLEHRARVGWDSDLPGAGLLVWRTGAPLRPGQPLDTPWIDLIEAHGIAAPDAALIYPDEVPFPGPRGGVLGFETHGAAAGVLRLRDIRRIADGSIAFRIGDPAPIAAPPPRSAPAPIDEHGFARLLDPITGERVRVFLGPPEDAPARLWEELEPLEPALGD